MRKSMHQACIMNESLKAFLHKNTKKGLIILLKFLKKSTQAVQIPQIMCMRKSMHQTCITNEFEIISNQNERKRPKSFAKILVEKHSNCR